MAVVGAGMTDIPASAQEPSAPITQDLSAVDVPSATTPTSDASLSSPAVPQAGQVSAPARLSIVEKAAAVTGAVAAGVVAFKGLSALLKKKKPADPAVPAN